MKSVIVSGWLNSAATFKEDTAEKLAFIFLCLADMVLTLVAANLGFNEINLTVRLMLQIPLLLLLVKLVIPVFIAWVVPGKFLWPAIVLLALVVLWNAKELAVFLV